MWEKFKKIMEFAATTGWYFPAAYDKQIGGPSVSLLFAHISFYIAAVSTGILIAKDTTAGTIAAATLAGLYFVFYMLRRLTKAKLDLDDRSIDLENSEDEKDENETKS